MLHTRAKEKKGKSPSTTKINDPFLAVILFLSPLYTRTLQSVCYTSHYIWPPLKVRFSTSEKQQAKRGEQKIFQDEKKLKCGRRHPPKIGPKTTSIYSSTGSHKKHFVTVIIINRFRAICVPLCSMERASLTTILRFIVLHIFPYLFSNGFEHCWRDAAR